MFKMNSFVLILIGVFGLTVSDAHANVITASNCSSVGGYGQLLFSAGPVNTNQQEFSFFDQSAATTKHPILWEYVSGQQPDIPESFFNNFFNGIYGISLLYDGTSCASDSQRPALFSCLFLSQIRFLDINKKVMTTLPQDVFYSSDLLMATGPALSNKSHPSFMFVFPGGNRIPLTFTVGTGYSAKHQSINLVVDNPQYDETTCVVGVH